MSAFLAIDKTLRQVLSDLALGLQIIGQNTAFDPLVDLGTDTEWLEIAQLPGPTTSMMKSGTPAADENAGIFQISVMSRSVGQGEGVMMALADTIAAAFKHGVTYTHFEDVFIQNTSRNTGRVAGGFYQLDLSISWTSYVDR